MGFSPLAATHYREAQTLFRRRQQLLGAMASPRNALRQLDWRLLGNLQAVALAGCDTPDPGHRPAALFVECWVRLLMQADKAGTAAELDELFPCLDAEQQQAVAQAVVLSPQAGFATVRSPGLQAAFCQHDHDQARRLDVAACSDELAAVVLWLWSCQTVDASRFRPFYEAQETPLARRQALIAGLIRKDARALHAARDYPDDPEIALLLAHVGGNVVPDEPLALALSGRRDAATALLSMMERVETADAAATAWFWLTGDAAPRKPRLQAVDEPGASAQTLPDAAGAATQWQRLVEQQALKGGQVFFGKPLTDAALTALDDQWCGLLSGLIAAHRALEAGRSGCPASGWQHHDLNGGQPDV